MIYKARPIKSTGWNQISQPEGEQLPSPSYIHRHKPDRCATYNQEGRWSACDSEVCLTTVLWVVCFVLAQQTINQLLCFRGVSSRNYLV